MNPANRYPCDVQLRAGDQLLLEGTGGDRGMTAPVHNDVTPVGVAGIWQ
jgi:hypothetical protein